MTTSALSVRLWRPALSGAWSAAWSTVGIWRERARQRRDLAEMSVEMLRDIGVSPAAARAEAGKPFWMH